MTGRMRAWLLGLVGAISCAGCDPATMAYFLMPEAKEDAELKNLASEDKKKEVKVVILTYDRTEPKVELIHVDRQLTEYFAHELSALFKANEQKVTIIPPRRVEEYKNSHPSTHGCDPTEVGKFFKADYVIYLELNEISLSDPLHQGGLLQGRAHIAVSLIDPNDPDATQEPREFTSVFPSDSHGPVAEGPEMPRSLFRQQFLHQIANQLSFYFAPHRKRERVVPVYGQ